MTFSRPKSPSTELEFEGAVEELRKDKKMYQKTAVLQLRSGPQSDLLVMNQSVMILCRNKKKMALRTLLTF